MTPEADAELFSTSLLVDFGCEFECVVSSFFLNTVLNYTVVLRFRTRHSDFDTGTSRRVDMLQESSRQRFRIVVKLFDLVKMSIHQLSVPLI
jgi:hypothetical protein